MTTHATGSFEVKLVPLDSGFSDPSLGRMTIEKQYHGDLEATSLGQMLTARMGKQDSGGYVAIEKVSGALNGQAGTFILQHNGIMRGSIARLTVTVVPESGTGQLEGIAGEMSIKIEGAGKHSYNFEYTLPTYI
jgi:hypothetical protein